MNVWFDCVERTKSLPIFAQTVNLITFQFNKMTAFVVEKMIEFAVVLITQNMMLDFSSICVHESETIYMVFMLCLKVHWNFKI